VSAGRAVRMKRRGAARPLQDVGFDHLTDGRGRPPVKRRANARRARPGYGAPHRPRR
jgi:hypothetical protein